MKYPALTFIVLLVGCKNSDEAEKLFRITGKKLANAKTVQISAHSARDQREGTVGELVIAIGNKAMIDLRSETGTGRMLLISDGTKIMTLINGESRIEKTPAELNSTILSLFHRAGLLLGSLWKDDEEWPLEEKYQVSGFRLGEKDIRERSQVIHFKMTVRGSPTPVSASLWIDELTQLPHKRILKGADNVTITETYAIKLNAKIDEGIFKIRQP